MAGRSFRHEAKVHLVERGRVGFVEPRGGLGGEGDDVGGGGDFFGDVGAADGGGGFGEEIFFQVAPVFGGFWRWDFRVGLILEGFAGDVEEVARVSGEGD